MASTALASPALAKDDSWYIGAEFGAMLVEDGDFTINSTTDSHEISHEFGFDGGGYVGYDFGGFRLEAEVSYRQADIDSVAIGAPGLPVSGGSTLTGNYNNMGGDADSLSFMLNGLLDFGPDDGLQGYVGGGVGVARTKYEVSPYSNLAPSIDDSDSGLAWQILAGVRAPLTDTIDVGLRYRYYNAQDVALVDLGGNTLEDTFTSHSLMGTLEYNFGEPAWDSSSPKLAVWKKRQSRHFWTNGRARPDLSASNQLQPISQQKHAETQMLWLRQCSAIMNATMNS